MAALHRADALASAAAVLAKITTGCEPPALPIGVSTVVLTLVEHNEYRDDDGRAHLWRVGGGGRQERPEGRRSIW